MHLYLTLSICLLCSCTMVSCCTELVLWKLCVITADRSNDYEIQLHFLLLIFSSCNIALNSMIHHCEKGAIWNGGDMDLFFQVLTLFFVVLTAVSQWIIEMCLIICSVYDDLFPSFFQEIQTWPLKETQSNLEEDMYDQLEVERSACCQR